MERRFSSPDQQQLHQQQQQQQQPLQINMESTASASPSAQSVSSQRSLRQRIRRKRHTIDTIDSNVVVKATEASGGDGPKFISCSTHLPPTPPGGSGSTNNSKKASLLMRFLAHSTSRRRSQNSGGSTVSRLTDDEPDLNLTTGGGDPQPPIARRSTMNDMEQQQQHLMSSRNNNNNNNHHQMNATTHNTPRNSNMPLLKHLSLNTFGVGGPRRAATMDMAISEHERRNMLPSPNSNHTAKLEPQDYSEMQERLQRQADDLHKGGQVEQAIQIWIQALKLAEVHHDTLTKKTELLCILVDLHLQASQQHTLDDQDEYQEKCNSKEDRERSTLIHQQAAKRYIQRIKPALVQPSWLGSPSTVLIEFFCQAEAGELALLVADQMLLQNDPLNIVTPQQLATMHFQVASQKLDSNKQGEALQHLQATVQQLQQVPVPDRDMTMYLQVLQLLATEYHAQSQYQLALEAYQEQLQHAPSEKQATLYCEMAQVYISTLDLDLALSQLLMAAKHLDTSDHDSIRLQLLQTKGDVYCRLGRMEESLQVYQQALHEVSVNNPAEKAKLLYTLGRLCVRLNRIRPAISYCTRELEITQDELGKNHLSVSRVLHELARLYDEGLNEHKRALMKLSKALRIELACLQDTHYAITQCPNCNPITHRMCSRHALLQLDLTNQIRQTKMAQGRIHFKLGDFDKAVKTNFQEQHRRRKCKR
jgi:tetratricopeptide (TPR) repeat protein